MKLYKIIILTVLEIVIQSKIYPQDTMSYMKQTPPGNIPEVFAPGIISKSNRYEQYTIWLNNGKEFYYQLTNDSWGGSSTYYTTVNDTAWDDPIRIDFGNPKPDSVPDLLMDSSWGMIPAFTPDGNHVYIMSDEYIYTSEKTVTGWTEAVKVDIPIEKGTEIWWISVTNDLTLYLTLGLESANQYNLYRAKKIGNSYPVIEDMSSKIYYSKTFFHYIAPDESYIIQSLYNATGGMGGYDLYISYNNGNDVWTRAKNMGSDINTGIFDMAAFVTQDQKYLFFTRRGDATNSDIFWMKTDIIDYLKTTNFAPYVKNPIPDQVDSTSNHFIYTIPDSTFLDDDGNETLTISAQMNNNKPFPDWLTYNEETRTFEGTPKNPTYINIKVTATDTAGASIKDIFAIKIEGNPVGILTQKDEGFEIFPNPVSDKIYIKYKGVSASGLFQIVSIDGKIIHEGSLVTGSINVADINSGLYILKIYIKDEVISQKILID